MAGRLYLLGVEALRDERMERIKNRRRLREALDTHIIPDVEFISNYRLSRELYEELCQEIVPLLPPKRNARGIDPATKILVALNFYARGSYQGSVGLSTDTPMAQPTVSRCLREVTLAINTSTILQKYLKFPQNAVDRNIIKTKFYERYRISGVVGCIDCTHVAIIRPTEHEERFFNRKHFHSINTQVICDTDCYILNIDATYGGATHDAFIWSQSEIKAHLEQLHSTYLLVSGPIQKKSSMSDDSSSDMMELEESALVMDPHLESNLRRLQEEERLLLEQQATMEASNVDDITALEHQDALRLNQLQQQELQRRQAAQAQRLARFAAAAGAGALAGAGARGCGREPPRRRAACTVRVNNVHAAEAIETDV